MFETNDDPEKLVKDLGLAQVNDEDAILSLVQEVMEENPQSIADYKSGRDHAMGYLIGQVMKKSKGKANPKMVSKMVKDALDNA